MDRWFGRVALVTGASSGFGAAICRQLVKHGMKVVGCARRVDKIEAIAMEPEIKASPGSLHPMKCDLTNEPEILAVFEFIRKQFGRIDVCINNAGFATQCSLMDGKTEAWRSMIDVNVMALCICTREAVQLMKAKNIDDGQIINISSICGHFILDMDVSLYTGTKFMVRALTESLRYELRRAKTHIRVACISPGAGETGFVSSWKNETEAATFYASMKCLQADDIASAVLTILQSPPHVDINDVIVRPVEQSL